MNISVDIQYMWRRVTVFNIQSMGVGDSVMGLQFKFHGMDDRLNATCEGRF